LAKTEMKLTEHYTNSTSNVLM